MKRDGHQCILTGFQDISHPSPDKNTPRVFLEACHILLRRDICIPDTDRESDSVGCPMSKYTSLEVDLISSSRLLLQHLTYFRIIPVPMTTFEDLQGHLNDPSNGMMLQGDAHKAYDDFFWCLKPNPMDVSNMVFDYLNIADNVSRRMCTL